MADRIHLKVITPTELVVDEQVDEVVAPGEVGEFGILPGHVPFLTTLHSGELKYKIGNSETKLVVEGGVADVRNDTVSILTDGVKEN
ncbi:MAG: ATP synthase F1 subunit epsilon [Thermodesulfobacteriales bacterium]|nr:MAG: ATP synthase F1 subunit epsilon [Thermodesulfobacteriales bacterium]